MRKSRFNEEQIIAILRGGGRDSARRAVSAARNHAREPVPLEGEVRRDGSERGAATAAAGGGEPAAEARRGRAAAGQTSVAGGALVNKVVFETAFMRQPR